MTILKSLLTLTSWKFSLNGEAFIWTCCISLTKSTHSRLLSPKLTRNHWFYFSCETKHIRDQFINALESEGTYLCELDVRRVTYDAPVRLLVSCVADHLSRPHSKIVLSVCARWKNRDGRSNGTNNSRSNYMLRNLSKSPNQKFRHSLVTGR